MTELKPCPFCGGKAELKFKAVNEPFTLINMYYSVHCTKCGLEGKRYHVRFLPELRPEEAEEAKKDASDYWNRRHNP